ncbi:MAG: LD-carboxypeptidase, partial [Bacteroidetes bacterium]
MISPGFLKKGDKVAIVASARKISKKELNLSFEIISSYGLDIVYTDSLFAEENQYAGSDEVRASNL